MDARFDSAWKTTGKITGKTYGKFPGGSLKHADGNWLTFRPIFAAQLVKAPYLFVITDDGDVFMKSLLISHYDGYLWILYLL